MCQNITTKALYSHKQQKNTTFLLGNHVFLAGLPFPFQVSEVENSQVQALYLVDDNPISYSNIIQ